MIIKNADEEIGVGFPSFSEVEKNYFMQLYKNSDGNIFQMHKISELSRATIYRKLKIHFGNFRKELKNANETCLPNC